jgi:hypothetical protein
MLRELSAIKNKSEKTRALVLPTLSSRCSKVYYPTVGSTPSRNAEAALTHALPGRSSNAPPDMPINNVLLKCVR